jgi:mannose-6-phosphate isomerase
MNNLYPLKFSPICKDKIWGGNKLNKLLNKQFSQLPNCGESWELSGIQDDISVVSNGFLEGNDLEELIEVYMGDLVGEKVYEKFGTEFPLLIKFIDANDYLSIQVHPNDALALERHDAFGKTEMWVVIQADPGSKLITGFNRKITKEEYLDHLNKGTIEDVLNYEVAKAGDVFFMPAGRIHAIGKGIVVAEIQQTSDVTYRIFDFNRVDDEGNTRELHNDLALDAIDFSFASSYRTEYKAIDNQPVRLVECAYFTTNILPLTAAVDRDFTDQDTFVIYMCIEGQGQLEWDGQKTEFVLGDTLLVPAQLGSFSLSVPKGTKAKLIEIYIA